MENTNPKVLKEMYLKLFSEITETIEELEKLKEKLKNVQLETEEIFIND